MSRKWEEKTKKAIEELQKLSDPKNKPGRKCKTCGAHVPSHRRVYCSGTCKQFYEGFKSE